MVLTKLLAELLELPQPLEDWKLNLSYGHLDMFDHARRDQVSLCRGHSDHYLDMVHTFAEDRAYQLVKRLVAVHLCQLLWKINFWVELGVDLHIGHIVDVKALSGDEVVSDRLPQHRPQFLEVEGVLSVRHGVETTVVLPKTERARFGLLFVDKEDLDKYLVLLREA